MWAEKLMAVGESLVEPSVLYFEYWSAVYFLIAHTKDFAEFCAKEAHRQEVRVSDLVIGITLCIMVSMATGCILWVALLMGLVGLAFVSWCLESICRVLGVSLSLFFVGVAILVSLFIVLNRVWDKPLWQINSVFKQSGKKEAI